jgi:cyclopropane-fatty-acyl-phospholipid synthase
MGVDTQEASRVLGSQLNGSPDSRKTGSQDRVYHTGPRPFTIIAQDKHCMSRFLRANPYSAALAFVRGEVDVEGDLPEAIRWKSSQNHDGMENWLWTAAAKLQRAWYSGKHNSPRNIHFHYDRPTAFYKLFLDPQLVYSCAYFADPSESLETAQIAKLDHICRKLDVHGNERFLDVGCGWGSLIMHAAERYGARSEGCTLSHEQSGYIRSALKDRHLEDRVHVVEADFESLRGRFDKIASVGMFEHVGRHRLRTYFAHVANLLTDEGAFLNHGITRPQLVDDGPETYFLQKHVFPGGDLVHVSDVCRYAEEAGFEVLDVENLRPHYALTCRAWVEQLKRNADLCMQVVDRQTYRTWLLYLAASAMSFEDGTTEVHQFLLAKRSARQRRHLTRDYIYS